MNKKIIPVAVIAFLILVVLGATLIGKKNQDIPSDNSNNKADSSQQSLKDIIAAGIPQKCTFKAEAEGGNYEGIVYSSGGKFRGDFTTVTDEATIKSHMIIDGTINYTWTDGQTTGYKMTVESEEAVDLDTNATPVAEVADLNQKSDYKCTAWIPDNSLFDPPKEITFTDLSALTAPDSASNPCSACDLLSGDSKTQCLSALKCQ